MKIAIDLQALQAEYPDQECPSAILETVEAFLGAGTGHEVTLVLSGLFPGSIESFRQKLQNRAGWNSFRIWHAPGPVSGNDPGSRQRRRAAEYIREGFLASLSPDFIVVTLLPGGEPEDCVFSFKAFAGGIPTAVVRLNSDAEPEPRRNSTNQGSLPGRGKCSLEQADFVFSLPFPALDQAGKILRELETRLPKRGRPAPGSRPRLAYVSPLPPMQTGVAEHGTELLPELSKYYQPDVIVSQDTITDPWISSNCTIRTAEWFSRHGGDYSRILYHFGNSSFHDFMIPLMHRFPGTVVLHDFSLGDLLFFLDSRRSPPGGWSEALYLSHGYRALRDKYRCRPAEVVAKYPGNLEILNTAPAVVVHSEYARNLALEWYGRATMAKFHHIPLIQQTVRKEDRELVRLQLGLAPDDFLVCCFGLLGATKLNLQILDAWLDSPLSRDPSCKLVYVGEALGHYGGRVLREIIRSGHENQVRVTGWTDRKTFCSYLSGADLAIQLRHQSRGESSGAVLNCMNFGLATIVNDHGSMSALPDDSVCRLQNDFSHSSLIEAMTSLWRERDKREKIGARAREYILEHHSAEGCGRRYVEVIEHSRERNMVSRKALAAAMAAGGAIPPDQKSRLEIARCIARNQPDFNSARTLFIDVTATSRNDLKTGIERVSRAMLLELIESAPPWLRIEPVYLSSKAGNWFFRYARHYTAQILQLPQEPGKDDPVEMHAGDMLLVPDLMIEMYLKAEQNGCFRPLQEQGIEIYFTIHDLLPVLMPHRFPPGFAEKFESWLECITRLGTHFICVSRAVAHDLRKWIRDHREGGIPDHLDIRWSHHGADIESSSPSRGFPAASGVIMSALRLRPGFLMVGTIEPRKGHLQVIQAFEMLWDRGVEINLIIVGREGWMHLADSQRRTIPETVARIRRHPRLNRRLFWLEGISDQFLQRIYAGSSCLLAASEGEGFGLPLIEAAFHGLPILAKRIPVFEEVAGEHACYFTGDRPEDVAEAVEGWLEMREKGSLPDPGGLPCLTWKESTRKLLKILLEDR